MKTSKFWLVPFLGLSGALHAQAVTATPDITQQQTYQSFRASSKESTGGNVDCRKLTPGETLTILDADGPGLISHMWFTVAMSEPYWSKRVVMRIYWDGEDTPSVETPLGDFFGLGLGVPVNWQSTYLSVGNQQAMNSFFPMPYAKHAKVTITNDGKTPINALYYNIDYRKDSHPLAPGTLYFHAQYRQAQPNKGWSTQWYENSDPMMNLKRNVDGKDNFVWFEAKGHGQYIGVTMSVLQNQDGWWGEGDDMFFIDGAALPNIIGTGSEDYFGGAWDFGTPFSYAMYGAPVVEKEIAGARGSVYRFHTDSPITFTKDMKATIEHGHANGRSDNFYSVAYWYQSEPHMAFPPLPSVDDRIPRLMVVGGPGNDSPDKPAPALIPR
jgi:hypothetical protein